NQIKGLVKAKLAHIPLGEPSLWAALMCIVKLGLIQVEPLAGVAKVDKGADMGAGAAGQVQVLKPLIAKQLMQPAHRGALGLVVDIGTHQIVIARQVGIESIKRHENSQVGLEG